MAKTAAPRLRRRERKNITSGTAHVAATFNNTMITITDAQGGLFPVRTLGRARFRGRCASRRHSPRHADVSVSWRDRPDRCRSGFIE
jgi:small subunit ribosomal protein S11